MTPEAWAFFGVLTTVSGGVLVEQIRTRKRVEHAVELSEPTGDGFAGKVTGALDRIEDRQGDIVRRLDVVEAQLDRHLSDHVAASLRVRQHNLE